MKTRISVYCILAFALWATPLAAQPDVEECNAPGTLIADGVVTTDSFTVVGSVAIEDLDVSVDLTIGFLGDLIISVSTPLGTSVELLAFDGAAATALDVVFDDAGEAQPPVAGYGCACAVMANGALAAVDGETSDGLWTLTIDDT
ncbi:MAG: proprotein convertase P-domain-containing protein, partial [Planctomycetes bacterium]|nr:proprotein convertase P-domain-containing protein [Planctomycetota bacterium]